MNRRHFLGVSAAMLSAVPRRASAQEPRKASSSSLLPELVNQALTVPNRGFPSAAPIFAGLFVPGKASAKLLQAASWDDFVSQAQQMAGAYTLSCFSAIQNGNQTWYYGAFEEGSADYVFVQKATSSEFMSAFTSMQAAYTLVDFNVSWQSGQLSYSGCWVAGAGANPQTLMLDVTSGISDLQNLAAQFLGVREMTRIQAYPFNDTSGGVAFAVLYTAGPGTGYVHDLAIPTFINEVEVKLAQYTLAGLGYNPVFGNLTGTWQPLVKNAQFFVNRTWSQIAEMAQAGDNALVALAAYPDEPSFDAYFQENLAPYVMGYGYAVARHGQIVASGGGYARSPHELVSPGISYTADTRMTLASVSKAITGIALKKLAIQKGWLLDQQPFLPLLNGTVTNPAPGVEKITLQNLANMQSGLPPDVTPTNSEGPDDVPQGESISEVINNYLKNSPANIGQTYYYDNTNFTILQAVIAAQSNVDYVTYVNEYVLKPAGIDTVTMSPDPTSVSTPQTLTYSGPNDTTEGYRFSEFTLVGVSGWVSSARELVKLLAALRLDTIFSNGAAGEMFTQSIGWNLPGNTTPPAAGPEPYVGTYGTYYWKEGGITHGSQSLETFLVRLGEGYDLALLINSDGPPVGITDACFFAFDARGTSVDVGTPVIDAIVHGASYLPAAAPGSYLAIIGSGFTARPPGDQSGVRVRVGSVSADVVYVSAPQVNILLPAGLATGTLDVELAAPNGVCTASLKVGAVAPGLFTHRMHNRNYAIARFAGTSETMYVAPVGALSGHDSRPAAEGDVIQLYGTGMSSAGDLSAVRASLDGIRTPVVSAAIVGPGLFQVTLKVPVGLSSGARSVAIEVNGVASQPSVYLTIG